jgi:hypothetical protein
MPRMNLRAGLDVKTVGAQVSHERLASTGKRPESGHRGGIRAKIVGPLGWRHGQGITQRDQQAVDELRIFLF